jgi:hypothetical protein
MKSELKWYKGVSRRKRLLKIFIGAVLENKQHAKKKHIYLLEEYKYPEEHRPVCTMLKEGEMKHT